MTLFEVRFWKNDFLTFPKYSKFLLFFFFSSLSLASPTIWYFLILENAPRSPHYTDGTNPIFCIFLVYVCVNALGQMLLSAYFTMNYLLGLSHRASSAHFSFLHFTNYMAIFAGPCQNQSKYPKLNLWPFFNQLQWFILEWMKRKTKKH